MDWKKLIEEIKESGISLYQIAEKAGVSHTYMYKLRNGECKDPTFTVALKIIKCHPNNKAIIKALI